MPNVLDRLRERCLRLPEAREVEAWGAPTFRVKTIFAMYSAADRHANGDDPSAWIKMDLVNQGMMIKADPARFFVPPYVGVKGWIGVRLNEDTDWDGLSDLLWDAWYASVPKRLAKLYPDGPT